MTYLAENALPIWIAGAVLLTMAAVVYVQLRTTGPLVAALVIVLLTGALLAYEHFAITRREAVEQTLYDLAAAIEADDLPGVLRFIAPTATNVRADAESLMPLVEVTKARILGTPEITVDEQAQPITATVVCQGFVDVRVKRGGLKAPYTDRVTIQFVEAGDRWQIESYTPGRDWRRAAGRRGR